MPEAQPAPSSCPGCGAQLSFPADELSILCPYCSSPAVDEARGRAVLQRVAPFRIERSVAARSLRDFLRSKIWAPTSVRKTAIAEKRLRGVLIPFHVYQGCVRAEYRARVGIYWYRTETYTDSDGKTKTRTVRETEWFATSGSTAYPVVDHLVSASHDLPEADSNALEPFDLGWARPFDARLVAGFSAHVPGIDATSADVTANTELRQICEARVEAELLPGDVNDVHSLSAAVEVSDRDVVGLPVWMAEYDHGGEKRRLLVNGQSGQCHGDVPVSWAKIVGAVLGVLLVVAVGLYLGGVFG